MRLILSVLSLAPARTRGSGSASGGGRRRPLPRVTPWTERRIALAIVAASAIAAAFHLGAQP